MAKHTQRHTTPPEAKLAGKVLAGAKATPKQVKSLAASVL